MIFPVFSRVYTFEQLHFSPEMVNGWYVREADNFVGMIAFMMLQKELPELRDEDIEYFDYQVDWLRHEVVVTESETIG